MGLNQIRLPATYFQKTHLIFSKMMLRSLRAFRRSPMPRFRMNHIGNSRRRIHVYSCSRNCHEPALHRMNTAYTAGSVSPWFKRSLMAGAFLLGFGGAMGHFRVFENQHKVVGGDSDALMRES